MRPNTRLFTLLGFWTFLGFTLALIVWADAGSWVNPYEAWLQTLWQGAAIGIGLLALVDLSTYRRNCPVVLERRITDSVSLDHWTPVELVMENSTARNLQVELFDHYPHGVEARNAHKSLNLRKHDRGSVQYDIKAHRRGDLSFGPIDILIPSLLGLWRFRYRIASPDSIKVYPNFSAVAQFAMLTMEQQITQMGVRKQQRRGEGLEFHQLREFRNGDSLRQIDWNASARIRKLISKEYQDETDQHIVFLLDCGRNMRGKDQQLSHFDHALNSVLLLSHVALKQGDSVGLLSFSGERRWVPPVKGASQIPRILHQVYDLKSTHRASDYLVAAQSLMAKQKKRSLVIVITNLHDEYAEDLKPAIQLMRKKHLVMLANLEEPFLQEVATSPVTTLDEAINYFGVIRYLDQKRLIDQSLNQQGIISVNSLPRELPINLINKYFEIKREGLL